MNVGGKGEGPLQGYEKIRTVGKGAFGLAVLYRRISDDTLVVIKQVNMIDLTAAERQLALNEVQVLSSLDHPNIISYRRSFERDGLLMIEMEYADGGNLAQVLTRRRQQPLSERAILQMFRQIAAALRYMHGLAVLHRDLKTANVFLTSNYTVKVGDFGISKVLTTRAQANTILGTPYYISPEMCEGKQYGPKSDMWALGCILYEMSCLEKPFEASNLPALVNKIMRVQFEPLPERYSPGLRKLQQDLLQREPENRPSAADVCDQRLPELLAKAGDDGLNARQISSDASRTRLEGGMMNLEFAHSSNTTSRSRSVLYELKYHGSTDFEMTPIPLPPRIKVIQVAVGGNHMLIVTSDCVVYSWGEGGRGQLGHGQPEDYREEPSIIEALRGKGVNKVCAGENFSVFGSESGMVLTCGEGTHGCPGHGDLSDCHRPRIVERLLSVDVVGIACGTHHVAALGTQGGVFCWGRGAEGRLGVGQEVNRSTPEPVPVPGKVSAVQGRLRCGPDCTVLISSTGQMLAWGSNRHNKLALSRSGFFSLGPEVEYAILPTIVSLSFKVTEVALGVSHSALVSTDGQLYTVGAGQGGQLGRAEGRGRAGPGLVADLEESVQLVTCGPDFSAAVTSDNVVYFWGTRHLYARQRPAAHQTNKQGKAVQQANQAIQSPEEILALYGPENIKNGPNLYAKEIYSKGEGGNLILLVDTTTPLPYNRLSTGGSPNQTNRTVSTSPKPYRATAYTIPDWLKAELAAAEN